MLIDESNLTLEISSEDYSIKENTNINICYDDLQYPEKFSWRFLKENQYYLNGISNYETFKIFQSLIPNKFDFAKNILKEKPTLPDKQRKHKNKCKNKLKEKQKLKIDKDKEKEVDYCICNKNNKAEIQWVNCENENGECPGKNWYHISCIPELKNYTIESFENKFEHYFCPTCREKYNLKNELKKENEENKCNAPLELDENNININITINNNEKNNLELELKKQESNVVEFVKIDSNADKVEEIKENDDKDKNENINNEECPMEIEKDENKESKEKIEGQNQ